MRVELEGQGLQKRNVIGHDLFVRKVKLVQNYVVDVIV